jgi:hypothetical protein
MTTTIVIDPMLNLYAEAYRLSKSWHTAVCLTDGMQDAIKNYMDAHPECVIELDDLDEYLDELEKEKDA